MYPFVLVKKGSYLFDVSEITKAFMLPVHLGHVFCGFNLPIQQCSQTE